MVYELMAGASMLLLAKVGPPLLPAPATAQVAGLELVLENDAGRCRVSSGRGSALLDLAAPCWFAADAAGHPFEHRQAGKPTEVAVLVVAKPYAGPMAQKQVQCGSDSQAVLVDASGPRPSTRVARSGVRCRGEPPDPAEWWLFLRAK